MTETRSTTLCRPACSGAGRVAFCRGGKWLNREIVLKDLIGGWEISGVTEFQVGVPVNVAQSNNTGGFTLAQRPNQIAPGALAGNQRTLSAWFNTAAFTVAPAF